MKKFFKNGFQVCGQLLLLAVLLMSGVGRVQAQQAVNFSAQTSVVYGIKGVKIVREARRELYYAVCASENDAKRLKAILDDTDNCDQLLSAMRRYNVTYHTDATGFFTDKARPGRAVLLVDLDTCECDYFVVNDGETHYTPVIYVRQL